MSGFAALRVKKALKRPYCETFEKQAAPEKRWRLELDLDSRSQLLHLFEKYKDVPQLRDTVFSTYKSVEDIPSDANVYPLLMLLKKHEKEDLEREVIFERYRGVSLKQELTDKDGVIQHMKTQYEQMTAQLKSQYDALLSTHAEFAKVYQENETLKAALFQAKRDEAALQTRLDNNTSILTGAFQARIHQVREDSTRLINDEYMKLTHHIRGELRKTPIDKATLLDGINEHVDAIRLAVGRSII
jgi:hypothetical protein